MPTVESNLQHKYSETLFVNLSIPSLVQVCIYVEWRSQVPRSASRRYLPKHERPSDNTKHGTVCGLHGGQHSETSCLVQDPASTLAMGTYKELVGTFRFCTTRTWTALLRQCDVTASALKRRHIALKGQSTFSSYII